MPTEKPDYVTPGQSLALICLQHWLRHVPREMYPSVKEVDALTRRIAHMVDRLYYSDGEYFEITVEQLENTIVDCVPWVAWPCFGVIEFQGFKLFRLSAEREGKLAALMGGSNLGSERLAGVELP